MHIYIHTHISMPASSKESPRVDCPRCLWELTCADCEERVLNGPASGEKSSMGSNWLD